VAAAGSDDARLRERLQAQQARLFDLGADLATPPDTRAAGWVSRVQEAWVAALEADIDDMERELPPLASFILPGGSPFAAQLHLARTVCRRAERRVLLARSAGEDVGEPIAVYLNRLSDWLFVAARLANARAGVADLPWSPDRPEA
jgi:cob(I)alamin adenosyltransferase